MEQPFKRVPLRNLTLTTKEYARLSLGLIPEEMEDKWFIYLEDNKLYCHRSWTGLCAYIVEFAPCEEGYTHLSHPSSSGDACQQTVKCARGQGERWMIQCR